MIVKIFMEDDGQDLPPEERKILATLTYNRRGWVIEGDVVLTPRLVWFMDQIHQLQGEYKRRNKESKEQKA